MKAIHDMTLADFRALPLHKLRNLDIRTIEQEKMVQSVINEKLLQSPVMGKPMVLSNKITDAIRTPEQEKEVQNMIDEHNAKLRQELLSQEENLEPIVDVIEEKLEEVKVEAPKAFCQHCDSKGVRHKKACTRVVTA